MSEFLLPSLGADMEAATLVEWRVQPGDKIKRGDIVAAVETDKGIIDIELFEEGIVDEICVQPGERVPVGTVLATFHTESEAGSSKKQIGSPQEQISSQKKPIGFPEKEITSPKEIMPEKNLEQALGPVSQEIIAAHDRQRISPAARRRARELDVDVEKIVGTGLHGAVTLDDVEMAATNIAQKIAATEKSNAEKTPVEKSSAEKNATGMRRAIGAAMGRSKREIPHYYLSTTIDMTRALTWLEQHNANRPVPERVVYAVVLLKAVALALKKVPELNGLLVDDEFRASGTTHIGVAISLRQSGLVVPALRDVDGKTIDDLMREFDDVVSRARAGHLRSSELQDSTITVTSLGEQGVETVFPIIYPPQVAIVGFGSIVERPWAIDGMLASRRVITATLAADHRVSDGHRGGLFLAALNRLLQEPEKL